MCNYPAKIDEMQVLKNEIAELHEEIKRLKKYLFFRDSYNFTIDESNTIVKYNGNSRYCYRN